jgi:O-antigen ligase
MKRAAGKAEATTVKAHRPRWDWRSDGVLFLLFPAMLALTALDVLLSGRDLTQAFMDLERETTAIEAAVRHPLGAWLQRGVSLALVAICLERLASHVVRRKPVPAPMLAFTFVFYWFTSVALPAVFGANVRISHEYAYPLLLGLACSLSGPVDRERVIAATRNGLFVFLLVGVALVPVWPSLVLDTGYTQGLIPGLPRFGGVSSHPVMLGMLSQTALVLLWVQPVRRGWLNAACWGLGLGVLFMAQSKTAWICFFMSACCLLLVRRAPGAVGKVGDPRNSSFGVGLLLVVIAAVLAALVGLIVFDLPTVIDDFFNSSTGAQLASLTGRDRIWAVAMDEWSRNPVFGYGLTIWDADHRQAILMPNATHAHNQFIDTLARSGTIGFIGLVVYALVLTVMAFRYARATNGLSMALWLTLALLSISEVPLIIVDYGSHVLTHFLLIVTVASGAAARVRAPRAATTRIEPSLRTA